MRLDTDPRIANAIALREGATGASARLHANLLLLLLALLLLP